MIFLLSLINQNAINQSINGLYTNRVRAREKKRKERTICVEQKRTYKQAYLLKVLTTMIARMKKQITTESKQTDHQKGTLQIIIYLPTFSGVSSHIISMILLKED